MSKRSCNHRLLTALRNLVEDDPAATLMAVTYSRDEAGDMGEQAFYLANGSHLAHAALRLLREALPKLREGCEHCRADGLVVERALAALASMQQHDHTGGVN
jgi:hypothetical protein